MSSSGKLSPEALETFGLAVRRARVLKGWTLEELGRVAFLRGEAKGFLSKIENGKRQISPLTAGKIARVLDLPKDLLAPFLALPGTETDEVTTEDREAETLIRMVEGDAGAPPAAEALMIALAYEFAQGSHVDLMTAYKGLRSALEAAVEIKQRGELPQNTGDQLQAVMRRVSELNDLGQREEAAGELDAAMARLRAEAGRLHAEREAIVNAQLDQDRILNRPEQSAERLIDHLRASAPPDGVFSATQDRLHQWRDRGETQGSTFDLLVALDLAKHNWGRARGPQRSHALGDLGLCHFGLGKMSAEDKHLRVAVKTFREATRLLPRRKDPMNWAINQNNLGTALMSLGSREVSTDQLEDAVAAFRAALEERTRDRVPLDWAMTQNNLGNALSTLGKREGSTDRLEEAVAAYRAALEEYTRDRLPLDWAMTQNNLGSALWSLGKREGSTDRLEEAVAAFRAALEERTRDRLPIEWAGTQNNLGIALSSLGEREGSTDRLEEAVAAFRAALEEVTRDRVPIEWAGTQNNLGTALRWLGQFKKDAEAFDQARAALKLCDEVQTRESVPFLWAETQWNLADLALARHDLSPDPSLLTEARTHLVAAREVFSEGAEHQTGRCDELLAKIDALEAEG